MRAQVLATAIAVLLGTASAAPTSSASHLVRRDDWTHDQNGNIHLQFSNETTRIGFVKIDDIMAKLAERCSTEGLCDDNTIDLKSGLIDDGIENSATVTIKPGGSYPTWIHNGLLDALGAAVKKVAKCEDVKYHTSTCQASFTPCPDLPTYTDPQCTVPQFWGITYQDPNASTSSPPHITNDVTSKVDDDGFCQKFAEIGSDVAGAVNGVAGGVFSLIGLTCK